MKNFRYKIIQKSENYAEANEINFFGIFGTKYHRESILLSLDSFDMGFYKNTIINLQENEHLFRYMNDRCKTGKVTPLVKINIEKGLIYFLSDTNEHSINDDCPIFNRRSEQLTFLVLKNNL